MRRRFSGAGSVLWLLCACLSWLGSVGVAFAEELQSLGELAVSAGVDGYLADPVCAGDETLVPSAFGAQVSPLSTPSGESPLLIDAGDLLSPHGVSRFATREAPDALAEAVAGLGYAALALGPAELRADRESLIATAKALRSRGVPLVATNLYCGAEAAALCDVLVDGADGISLHTLGDTRVGLISVLDPQVLAALAPESAAGLRLAPTKELTARAVAAARALGASVVVVVLNQGEGADAAAAALDLAAALEPEARPDLLIASGAGGELLFARPAGFQPAIVAAPPAGVARVRVRRNRVTGTFDVLATPVSPGPEPHPALRVFADAIGPRYCEAWGRALPGAHLASEMTGEELFALGASAVRDATEADVVVLRDDMLDPRWKLSGRTALTASDVYVALRFDAPLVTARVSGEWIATLKKGDLEGLTAFGLEGDASAPKVLGHKVEPRARYRVATTRLSAARLPAGALWEPVPRATVRSVLLARLSREAAADPRARFGAPPERPEWMARADVQGQFSGSTVHRGDGMYEDPQLARDETVSLGVNTTLRADAAARLWGWDNLADLRYARTRTPGAGAAEGADLASLRSSARWRGLRDRVPHFYVPEPFVEVYVETEFTKPADRDFHHLLLRPLLGVQFSLTEHLSLKLQGGFERELLDEDADVLPGVGAQVVLKPWAFLTDGTRKVTVEAQADYFVADFDDRKRQTFRGNGKLAYDLVGPLAFGVSLDLFIVKEDGRPAGLNANTEAFLRLSWLGRMR